MFFKEICKSIFLILFFLFPGISGAMNVNEIIKLNTDGSGFLNLTYWEKENIVNSKNSVIGNFPFTKEKAEQMFNSANTQLQAFEVGKNAKDNSSTEVKARIHFTNITKIVDVKALNSVIVSFNKTDTGTVLTYMVPAAYGKSNSIENLYVIVNYDGKIRSSSGKLNANSTEWYRSNEFLNANKNIYFVATFEGIQMNDPNKKQPAAGNEKKESCGLFGIELPLILFGGALISRKFRRNTFKVN